MEREEAAAILSESFARACQQEEEFARSVYDLFFQAAPAAKSLFSRTDWPRQQKMVIGALLLMVKNLNNPTLFRATMRALAERHVRYGVKAEYFTPFSQAVRQSLEKYLGAAWQPQVAEAWDFAFDQIRQLMLEAGVPA
ncbi:MAG: globin domain-containing protein [Pseudanabaenaceae cyanobacterium]